MTLRVGLLECDHVDDRFRSIAGDYADMFASLLPDVDLVPYDVCNGTLPATPDECDGWVATGSRHSVYDDLGWITALSGFVRSVPDAGAPYVGICFGHQLLAHALGGRTERASAWGAGAHRMEVFDAEAWMDPRTGAATLLYMHQDQVAALPEGTVVLGRTDHCPVAMLQVGRAMLGMQAHPEFPPEYLEALLDARAERIGAERTASARRSLASPTDAGVIARWIVRFLEEAVSA
jgi:GMP synthase-like glutamine amidotransferase